MPGCCCSVPQSCPTLGLQHARLPCPSISPRVCLDSCPLSQWCLPIILSSVAPFSFCLSLSQHQAVHIKQPKYWSFSFSISPSNEYSGVTSFRIDWLISLLVIVGIIISIDFFYLCIHLNYNPSPSHNHRQLLNIVFHSSLCIFFLVEILYKKHYYILTF